SRRAWHPTARPRARILARFCYHPGCGAPEVLRSGDRSEPPRPGPGRRSRLGVPRRSPHALRAHRQSLPAGARDATPRAGRGHALRALRGRARVRTQGPLPRPSAAPVLRVPLRMTAPVLDAERLRGLAEDALDDTLRSFADAHGAEALPALAALASGAERAVRRAAKRALYRLAQRGVTPPPRPAPRPVVERAAERATRAWVSGVDGIGSRAVWILFEGGFGGAMLCSLIVNDTAGILE